MLFHNFVLIVNYGSPWLMDLSHLLSIKCTFLHKDPECKFISLQIGLKFSRMNLKFTAHNQIRIREEEES